MLVDRSRFLKLAVALAATTSVATAACSATPEESDGEAGAAGALSGGAGGECIANKSISKPGEGSKSFYAYEEGFCFGLAGYVGEPDEHGISTDWFDFIYDQCRAYSQQLQPAVAKTVKECLAKADKDRNHNAKGEPTEEFDAGVMYDCGKKALYSICYDGIDGRVMARAGRIALLLKERGDGRAADGRKLATIQNEVAAVLSGLKSDARAQIEACVAKKGFDLYTCVEGISIGLNAVDAESGELPPSEDEACAEPRGTAAPAANACDAVLSKIDREAAAGEFFVRGFAKSQCQAYLKYFEPAAAREAIDCLTDPVQKTYPNIYTCGANGLKKVCPDPGSLDSLCTGIFESMVAIDPSHVRVGNVMRECHTLMPGLNADGRKKVKECVPTLTRLVGGEYALYSCVEGLSVDRQ